MICPDSSRRGRVQARRRAEVYRKLRQGKGEGEGGGTAGALARDTFVLIII